MPKALQKLFTIKQASAILNVHPNTLRNWDRSGYLKAIRVGPRKERRYRQSDITHLKLDPTIN